MVILKSLSIRTATLATCGLIAGVSLVSAAFSYWSIDALDKSLRLQTDKTVPSLIELYETQDHVGESRLLLSKYLLATPGAEVRQHSEELDRAMRTADAAMSRYRKLITDEAEQQVFDKALASWNAWKASASKVRAVPEADRATVGQAIYNGEVEERGETLSQNLSEQIELNGKEAKDAAVEAKALVSTAMTVLMIIAAAAVAAMAFTMSILRNRLSGPLGEITTAMTDMAGGNLDRTVPCADLTDEVGSISRALTAIKDGVSERTRAEAARQAAIQARVVESLASSLGKLKDGKLDCLITEAFPGEYEALRVDFNETVQSLSAVMTEVTAAAESVTTGSSEIASAASDLSSRTISQAAAIEETSASVRQLSSSVNETAQVADQVNRNAREAETAAAQSGEVMTEAVGAMEEISRSSAEMEAIVSLIDGIAFQTNLLALNAGVEAARAGEAGKGFAVVASEVRSLAQRAGEAAREITTIIKASSSSVGRGVSLINRTQDALQQIHARTSSVAEMIGTIASAANEQAGALGQIDAAVAEMDGMTQKNAALVEESTAASRTLANEAQKLDQLMRRFDTGAPRRQTLAYRPAAAPAAPAAPQPHYASDGNAALAQDWSSF